MKGLIKGGRRQVDGRRVDMKLGEEGT